jgi:L-2,4-diaminobutyric acid acetyltransferase
MKPAVWSGRVPADTSDTSRRLSASPSANAASLRFRSPTVEDARRVWELVVASGVLEPNSLYCYLLLCRDFAETSLVAYQDTELVAFVAAYRPPQRGDCLFVWQIGVSPKLRRQGVAGRLLQALLQEPGCRTCRYVEATVTPSNSASQRLFERLAEALGVPCERQTGFGQELFGADDGVKHEEEQLFRIGPLKASGGDESNP